MEWILAVLCMAPAAVSDVKSRTVSLESCVAAVLVGWAALAWWAVSAPPAEALASTAMAGSLSGIMFAVRRTMGGGDWWFIAGAGAASATLGYGMVVAVMVLAAVPLVITHVACCVRRPGLPFPRRLYRFVKREGDRFCVDARTGELVPPGQSGMVVKPGLPMVAYVVGAAAVVGAMTAVSP